MSTIATIDAAYRDAFAALSGDFNPLHVDATQARRSQFGGCVVHGICLVLGALDALPLQGRWRIERLDAQFRAAVMVGETVGLEPKALGNGEWRVDVKAGSQVQTVVKLSLVALDADCPAFPTPATWPAAVAGWDGLDTLATLAGIDRLVLDPTTLSVHWPSVAAHLAGKDIAALLASTRVVGMQCPGRWALFRRLLWERTVDATGTTDDQDITWRVSAVDRRFSLITLGFRAGARHLRAEVILREPPPTQLSLSEVRAHVAAGLYANQRALVVGGSRGLGELAAKVLAAGGAEVLIAYRSGADDARRVADELGPTAQTAQLDVAAPSMEALAAVGAFAPTIVAHFATPPILKRPPRTWDTRTYIHFVDVYVRGLATLLDTAQAAGALAGVFCPSSSFVDEKPPGFSEYVAAKRAAEALCDGWQQAHPGQRVVVERLPPLLTDQTAAGIGGDVRDNLARLGPALRRLSGA